MCLPLIAAYAWLTQYDRRDKLLPKRNDMWSSAFGGPKVQPKQLGANFHATSFALVC